MAKPKEPPGGITPPGAVLLKPGFPVMVALVMVAPTVPEFVKTTSW